MWSWRTQCDWKQRRVGQKTGVCAKADREAAYAGYQSASPSFIIPAGDYQAPEWCNWCLEEGNGAFQDIHLRGYYRNSSGKCWIKYQVVQWSSQVSWCDQLHSCYHSENAKDGGETVRSGRGAQHKHHHKTVSEVFEHLGEKPSFEATRLVKKKDSTVRPVRVAISSV